MNREDDHGEEVKGEEKTREKEKGRSGQEEENTESGQEGREEEGQESEEGGSKAQSTNEGPSPDDACRRARTASILAAAHWRDGRHERRLKPVRLFVGEAPQTVAAAFANAGV
jgi:hypothetical protein